MCCGFDLPTDDSVALCPGSNSGNAYGHLMNDAIGDVYGGGGVIASGQTNYNWVFPRTCNPGSSGFCFIAWPNCPSGGYESKGQAGMIFLLGGGYGEQGSLHHINIFWRWYHPLLCCATN